MSYDQTEVTPGATDKNRKRNRLLIYAVVLSLVFLLGFVPTCLVARRRGNERDAAQAALRISHLQNSLGNAIVDVRNGNFEFARLGTSEFFTNLRNEVDRDRDPIFNEAQVKALRSLLEERDNTITLLARSDPYSADNLLKLYNQYREAVAPGSIRK
ncbi:MAG TPA: hypothetical protein VIB00_17515 [Pyrinomonadaceae bacterium]|jgi:hypothetical protein